jgi:hypothetical protein
VDFALSPDWPALWCYFIILAIGFVAATVQINRLFPGFPQAWLMMSNWVLFAAFLLLPVLLFWFLDRTAGGAECRELRRESDRISDPQPGRVRTRWNY